MLTHSVGFIRAKQANNEHLAGRASSGLNPLIEGNPLCWYARAFQSRVGVY